MEKQEVEWAGPGRGWFASEGEERVQSDAGALSWALAGRTLCCNGEHRGGESLRRSVWECCV